MQCVGHVCLVDRLLLEHRVNFFLVFFSFRAKDMLLTFKQTSAMVGSISTPLQLPVSPPKFGKFINDFFSLANLHPWVRFLGM